MDQKRHWNWFAARVPEWVEKGIITSQQAGRLLDEVPDLHVAHSLSTRILIGFSALLFGLGIISFFAFNWQSMPKWLKLATIFTAFISAHGAGVIFGHQAEKKTYSEFFHLLGTLLFGAGIVLIAQIYHIDEHFPNGILLWSFGALLMAYGLDSTPQMLIYAALLLVWQFMERSLNCQNPGDLQTSRFLNSNSRCCRQALIGSRISESSCLSLYMNSIWT